MNTVPRTCVRCRQPLPKDSGFCVSCGNHDATALAERKVNVIAEAEDRVVWLKWLLSWVRSRFRH